MPTTSVSDMTTDPPIARLDTSDEMLAQPLREFLEGYGIRVYVNQVSPIKPNYQLVLGDPEFVKSFLAAKKESDVKSLIIIYNATESDAKFFSRQSGSKVILLDQKIPNPRVINKCFGFFFTGKNEVLDLRLEKTEVRRPMVSDSDLERDDRLRIQKSIDSIFKKTENSQKEIQSTKEVTRAKNKKQDFSKLFLIPLTVLAAIVIPSLWYSASLLASVAALYFAGTQIYAGNPAGAEGAGKMAQSWLRQSEEALYVVATPFRLSGRVEAVRGEERLLSFLNDLAESFISLGLVSDKGKEVADLLLTTAGSAKTTQSPAIAVGKLQEELSVVENKLSRALAELTALTKSQTFPFSLGSVNTLSVKTAQKIGSLHQTMTYLDEFLSLYPELSGFREKRTYLVLFQNSTELRPTGGFIGSLAEVSFDQGRLAEMKIQDVYSVDGQLKGHVDPPKPVREILNEEHWYLRDSNWDPNFAESGKRAAWFYQKETGKTVDGVVAISSPFLVGLLRATGPIELLDYNDRITAENFYGKSLYYTQTDFFPGSTQKKDFLGSLANALIAKLTSDKSLATPRLFSALSEALSQGDILLTFTQPEEQAAVERFGWAGRMPVVTTCSVDAKSPCLADALSVVEANLGVNKVNYYVERQEQNQIVFSEDGSVKTTVSLIYKNTSSTDKPPPGAGTYKAYVRFYLPPDAVFDGGVMDATSLVWRDPNKSPPPLPYLEESEATAGARLMAIAFAIPPSSEHRLAVTYHRQNKLEFGKNGATYDLLLWPQPGLATATAETQINFPIFWTARDLTGEGTLTLLAKQGQLEYNNTLLPDRKIKINFTK